MSNDKTDATWHPMPSANKALDEIAAVLVNRVGDPDIANMIALKHIENIIASTGRTTT